MYVRLLVMRRLRSKYWTRLIASVPTHQTAADRSWFGQVATNWLGQVALLRVLTLCHGPQTVGTDCSMVLIIMPLVSLMIDQVNNRLQ